MDLLEDVDLEIFDIHFHPVFADSVVTEEEWEEVRTLLFEFLQLPMICFMCPMQFFMSYLREHVKIKFLSWTLHAAGGGGVMIMFFFFFN